MSFEHRGHAPLKYHPVSYPGSVLRFRGPACPLDRPFIACLGPSETFGRFVERPYPALLARDLDMPVVNLGVMNAGLDVLMRDPAILRLTEAASAVVVQVPGAANMTNRFYTVHPRRNDRFLRASTMLGTFYPEVDFTEFHFTRHLLSHLRAVSEDRFAIVVAELQTAWRARMRRFLGRLATPVHLLWLSNRPPGGTDPAAPLGGDPLFVTPDMLSDAAVLAASLTVATAPPGAKSRPTLGKIFAEAEAPAARVLPGAPAHVAAAKALAPLLRRDLAAADLATGPRRP